MLGRERALLAAVRLPGSGQAEHVRSVADLRANIAAAELVLPDDAIAESDGIGNVGDGRSTGACRSRSYSSQVRYLGPTGSGRLAKLLAGHRRA